jgi:DNA (cytosine-5)-methyltransferase 1
MLSSQEMERSNGKFTSVGLFAGIGGIERGLLRAGFSAQMVCEIDTGAVAVLGHHFDVTLESDVRTLKVLPKVNLVAGGFPCQDLSQAGRTAGIVGDQSGLVKEVFRLLRPRSQSPDWLLLENVSFMLKLQQGRAMRFLVDQLESLGFTWAYRVVDSQAFGLPQRRKRVLLLASRTEDPRDVLFGDDAGDAPRNFTGSEMCGFYWTEGSRGLGWAVDAIPTLKGGSALGIPSPPAIWDPVSGTIGTPQLGDAERLQGFPQGWTTAASRIAGVRPSHRWKLIGNAVSVPVAEWIGKQIVSPPGFNASGTKLARNGTWPQAAWGHKGHVYSVDVSAYPVSRKAKPLREFLRLPLAPLSERAASGFLSRARASALHFEQDFLQDVEKHVKKMRHALAA